MNWNKFSANLLLGNLAKRTLNTFLSSKALSVSGVLFDWSNHAERYCLHTEAGHRT